MVPTELAAQDLRRYESRAGVERTCPGRMGYHDASVRIEDIPHPGGPEAPGVYDHGRHDFPHDDPRWPKVCAGCGKPFEDDDPWQHNIHRLYRGAPDGKLYSTRDMPPGAMYDAWWWPEPGPDGIRLAVVLPPDGGDDVWMPDRPSKQGTPWKRTGAPPKVTATPSVQTSRWHGYLTDGFLVPC